MLSWTFLDWEHPCMKSRQVSTYREDKIYQALWIPSFILILLLHIFKLATYGVIPLSNPKWLRNRLEPQHSQCWGRKKGHFHTQCVCSILWKHIRQFNLLIFPKVKSASQICFLDMSYLHPVTKSTSLLYFKQYWTYHENTKKLEIVWFFIRQDE